VALAGVKHDTRLYAYLLEPTRTGYSLDDCILRSTGRQAEAGPAAEADCTRFLAEAWAPEIDAAGLRGLYEGIELPLTPVLRGMEKAGVGIDREALRGLSADLERRLEELTAGIHRLAGKPFNINSPQQLGKVLFEDLNLPRGGRSAKTKAP